MSRNRDRRQDIRQEQADLHRYRLVENRNRLLATAETLWLHTGETVLLQQRLESDPGR